ncbi:MAG: ABC transporter substrate-binding protein [Deltaproteobacteria bacterium]|nr:ABC transporter substrate-binding protein [Deltaproteobacteria bacterium]
MGVVETCGRGGPVLLLAGLLVLTGPRAGAQPLPVRFSYSAPSGSNSPAWMAKELGLFERHGLRLSMIYIGGGTRPVSVMLAGETDFTTVTGPPAVLARLSGSDTTILATFINGLTTSIVARPEIRQPSDLRGKRMGITRFGVIGDFATRIALKRWGLVPFKDVGIIQMGGLPEVFAALRVGSVQAAAFSPPLSMEAKRLGMVELLDFSGSDIEFANTGLVSTARYVNAHGEATRRVVRAIVEGIWALKANREAAIRAIEKYTRVTDRKVLEETYQIYRKDLQRVPRTTDGAIRFYNPRFIDELDQVGFFRGLAERYPEALR